LTRADLTNDPEGRQIALGYLQYIKVLGALKDVRDASVHNANTPIILAGLVAAEDGGKLYNTKGEDMVGRAATIGFLREHGVDSLVDAYGIHTYPSSTKPGDPEPMPRATRSSRASISANAGLPVVPTESRVGSRNGAFRMPMSRARAMTRIERSWWMRCARTSLVRPRKGASSAPNCSPGTRTRGRRPSTATACIAAAV